MMHVNILGPLEIYCDDGQLLVIRRARLRTLLVVLAINANKVVQTSRIISLLWGQDAPTGSVHAVHSYTSALRHALGPHLLVHNARPGYRMDLGPGQLDATEFKGLLQEGTQAFHSRDYPLTVKTLKRACGLWRDQSFPDFPATPAIRGFTRKLTEDYLAAQDLLADARLALGLHREAVPSLRERTTEHPDHERAWMQLMIALYLSEMRAEALATFTEARSALLETSGIEPGSSMRRLHQQMLRDDPSLSVLTSHLPREVPL